MNHKRNAPEVFPNTGNRIIYRLQRAMQNVRFLVRTIIGFVQSRNDKTLVTKLSKAQGQLGDKEVGTLADMSRGESDDIAALRDYLLPIYQRNTISHYDPLFFQAVEEEMSWFIYPIFDECLRKFSDPQKIIEVFQNSISALNLLGRNTQFNQKNEGDNPLFLNGELIEATSELKQVTIGKVGGCPLMRIKSSIKGTLMTDFMITCIKFWLYRKFSQRSK